MRSKPLRSLQVGDIAYLEGCGIVHVLAVQPFTEWVEVAWDRAGTGVTVKPSHTPTGFWSAFYADYPEVHTYSPPH